MQIGLSFLLAALALLPGALALVTIVVARRRRALKRPSLTVSTVCALAAVC